VKTTLSERLIAARKKAGLSQEEAGKGAGKSERSVARYESGKVPPVDYVRWLAKESGEDAAWLVMGEESAAHGKLALVQAVLDGKITGSVEDPDPSATVETGRLAVSHDDKEVPPAAGEEGSEEDDAG